MNCLVLKIIWIILASLVHVAELRANTGLQITLVPPDQVTQLVSGKSWKLYLQGVIDAQASQRLAGELSRNNVQHGHAFLDSPGGNLKAGIEIGRLLRKHGLSTYVRKHAGDLEIPGECLSACVYAFVGGYFRYLKKDEILGIHRFSTSAPTSQDLDRGQIVSGAITAYLGEMGVDVRLFQLATRVGGEQIYRLSLHEAIDLRVANNGVLPAKWSIEASGVALYLRGTQEAWHGPGKVIFGCIKNEIIFVPYYGPVSSSETIVSTTIRHSLRLGDEFIDIGAPTKPLSANNGVVSAAFRLPASIAERIKSARSVGYAAHPGNPDLFRGFTVEIGTERQKISNYWTQCLSTQQK
jgi:hypothetical protein